MAKVLVVSALVAGLSGLAHAPAAAEPGAFNGTWSVELTTESGMCGSRHSAVVAVVDGAVRAVGEGAHVSGRVSGDGTVGLSVSHGMGSGAASGRLGAQTGSGTWKAAALCAGRWVARRQTTRTAQAN